MRPRNRLDPVQRAIEKLRKHRIPGRTSTYREGSDRQLIGAQGEATAKRWLQEELVCAGSDWTVLNWDEAKRSVFGGCGPFDTGGRWEAIKNAQNGDLYVYRPGVGHETLWHKPPPELLFSVEVKCSNRFRNVSITWNELDDSSAQYLLGVTPYGTWITSMDEARGHCVEVERPGGGSYFIVPRDRVRELTIKEIIHAEEDRREPFIPGPDYEPDIPF